MNKTINAIIGLLVIMICSGATFVLGGSDAIAGAPIRGLPELVAGFAGVWVTILAIRMHISLYLQSMVKAKT